MKIYTEINHCLEKIIITNTYVTCINTKSISTHMGQNGKQLQRIKVTALPYAYIHNQDTCKTRMKMKDTYHHKEMSLFTTHCSTDM
jgi:hypothetical protein